MIKLRKSKQRDRILHILKNTRTHPTASWIYDKLKDEFPNLSMGTVYRNLNILVEQGLVKKIDFGSTFDRFEATLDPHYHFICEKCHSVIDLNIPIDNELNKKIKEATGLEPIRHRIEFYGVCNNCKKE